MGLRPLTAEDLLSVWEEGSALAPAERALAIAAAATGEPEDELAAVPVGALDARLLDARERNFGSRVQAVAGCPECGEQLELDFGVEDIRVDAPAHDERALAVTTVAGELRFRLPEARDLVAAAGARDPVAARRLLLERCLAGAPADALDPAGEHAVAAAMAEADPQADVRLALECEACGHSFEAPFDIGAYLWSEVEARALRLLCEVHVLARAYGWTEREVLALSDSRRSFYLEAVSA